MHRLVLVASGAIDTGVGEAGHAGVLMRLMELGAF